MKLLSIHRNRMTPRYNETYRYVELHTRSFSAYRRRAQLSLDELNPCSVRRFVVIREPYSQYLSEMQQFPELFKEPINSSWYDNFLVCRAMGMCERVPPNRPGEGPTQTCSAGEVLAQLEREFHFVGFSNRLDGVFEALAQWAACNHTSDHATPQDPRSANESIAAEFNRLATGLSQTQRTRPSNATARVEAMLEARSKHPLVPGAERISNLSIVLLRNAPNSAVFAARNRCALQFWQLAVARFGPKGGYSRSVAASHLCSS